MANINDKLLETNTNDNSRIEWKLMHNVGVLLKRQNILLEKILEANVTINTPVLDKGLEEATGPFYTKEYLEGLDRTGIVKKAKKHKDSALVPSNYATMKSIDLIEILMKVEV